MEYRPADFTYWDTVENFTLTEAAWLWCDLEPPERGFEHMPALGKGIKPHPLISNLPAKGDRAARAMWQDATESETTNRLIWITNSPDTRYLFPRPYLRAWAENHSDYRPRFLFPEVGKPSKPRITERDEESAVMLPTEKPLHENSQPVGHREQQWKVLINEIDKRKWKSSSIPFRGKKELRETCCADYPRLFTDAAFDHFWRWARKEKNLR